MLAPEIEDLRRQFEQIATDADALAVHLRDDQFAWRPAPHVWSVAECLEHLNATARAYLPKVDECIAAAVRSRAVSSGPFRPSRLGRVIVQVSEPRSRIRIRSPKIFLPADGVSKHDVMTALGDYQRQFIERLHQANGLDLARARVTSPVTKWVRLPLGTGLALIAAHERRHLWQARTITAMKGFPA